MRPRCFSDIGFGYEIFFSTPSPKPSQKRAPAAVCRVSERLAEYQPINAYELARTMASLRTSYRLLTDSGHPGSLFLGLGRSW
jgi:hypothetical protein